MHPLDFISNRLQLVEKAGLISEVVYFALKAMKEDPSLEIEEALEYGMNEWDI